MASEKIRKKHEALPLDLVEKGNVPLMGFFLE